jgi:polysaccharide biosynthesis/export protein
MAVQIRFIKKLRVDYLMRWFILKFILLSIIYTPHIFSQSYPDYRERTFSSFTDTIKAQNFIFSGTEGAINASEYIIGPGDILFISISGLQENTFTLPVDHEGNIYIPKVGGIKLKNHTLNDSREKIFLAINRFYKDVEIFITLAEFKKIKVSLIGDVVKPGNFILPGNSRLLDLISISSGLNPSSNYRRIKIVDENNEHKGYDLLSFLRFGDKRNNPQLREGNIVIIEKIDQLISISGLVKYPGSYEYLENETIKDIINLAGGFLNKARKDSIEVVSFDEEGKSQFSRYYNNDNLSSLNVLIKNQDHIIVRHIPDFMIDRYVTISGYVKYPGFYKIVKDNTTLYDLIKEAGYFTEEASLTDAIITRSIGLETNDPELERLRLVARSEMTDDEYDYLKARSRQRKGKVVVDFVQLFQNSNMKENIILMEGDVINIPQKKNYVVLLGQIVRPGNIIYDPAYNYEDYINLAGGYGWRALESEVRIVKANTGEWIYAKDVIAIEPGDAIWIPEDPPGPKFWDVFTTSLTVLGQVATVVAAVIAVVVASR